jgi:hypothetical protein
MALEVNIQDVIDQLLVQNRQLVLEITALRISLGLTENGSEQRSETTQPTPE